ncbi:hypothetical protein [Streptomyces sp. NBC_00338]|uniref:hypothetical protein n=1 Tax=Streptomyces sp. NBC_00338 TaxID=2975715 RepID=UPI00225BFC64|nr:hypothetical protein [Streptomyces sp. NBC_00338]MCX5144051.1 hypothetical protein [Streptomyces sp. NBC_00338]
MAHATGRRRTGALAVISVAAALLTGCAEKQAGTEGAPAPRTSAPVSGKESPGPSGTPGSGPTAKPGELPDAYDFTPDPARVPKSAPQARTLTRRAVLGPDDWTAGMAVHRPYESSGTWTVLEDSCVWSRAGLPDHVLDSFTRRLDVPAADGRGRVQGAMTVTVHRTVADADREIEDTVQESFRCPDQELGGGQRLSGLMSLQMDRKDVHNADASLFEAGKYEGPGSNGRQHYVWSKSRIGTVTAAVSVKGAKGYENTDLLRIAAEGAAKILYRIELALK